MHILIVDDDIADRKLIRRALGPYPDNHKIDEATSAAEGLALIESKRYDIVLLDYKMPKVNGIEMVIELRSRPNLGETAIVMMSSSEEHSLALSCIEAGAQDFLAKSEISSGKVKKAMLHAKKRFEIEQKMHSSYIAVKEMAEKDPLTGLSNRYHFDETLKVMIANNKRSKHSVALIALDLDNFKHVNDTLGHDAGDHLLKLVVKRINTCLRSNEGFARLGGDEFAIILGGIASVSDVSNIADRILAVMNRPFVLSEQEFLCSVSIGCAMFPADACTSEDLMKSADIAMYRAKQSGKNKVCFYEKEFQTAFNKRFLIHNSINRLLASNAFELHYQPIFDLTGNDIVSFEALARWPQGKEYFTPNEFIPIAEETRVITELGAWVIKTALEQLSHWQKLKPSLSMSINISPIQLIDDCSVETIKTEISRLQLPPSSVSLEITETALFEDDEKIQQSLDNLADFGCRIALDDFGMGFSSIAHLMQYPIHIVKLDKSMQSNEYDAKKREHIFEALTLMLQKLEFTIVAEGIETQEQLSLCKRLHVDFIQGFLLGKPAHAETVGKKLA